VEEVEVDFEEDVFEEGQVLNHSILEKVKDRDN
jgi:hypothetical protein